MESYLCERIKEMRGNFLSVGSLSDALNKAVNDNDKLLKCYVLEKNFKSFGKKKFIIRNRSKKVNIKKIKKVFKKKRIDNIICDFDIVRGFTKTFVRDSVYINKGKLYIYGRKDDLEGIKNKYLRYTKDIVLKKVGSRYILIVDNTNTKNNKFKDIGYWWADTFTNFIDILTLILVN